MGKYGTNLEGFGGFEGGVNADNGATLVSTNSDGEKSSLLGPAVLGEIFYGAVANGNFEVLPEDPSSAISEENPLPYFTLADGSSGRIVATSVPSTLAVGQSLLRFTMTSALAGDTLLFTRYIPVPTSEARSFGAQFRVAVVSATSSANYQVRVSAQYVLADQATTTGTIGTGDYPGTTIATYIAALGSFGVELSRNPNANGSAPADAAYLLITFGIVVTSTVSGTVDVSEARIDQSRIQYMIADQTNPSDYGYGALFLAGGNAEFASNELGPIGSRPVLRLNAQSGDITLNTTRQGYTISLTSASRTASTVTIVTTRAHGFATGYEVVVAGITGTPGTTMNGTFIVTVTNTTTFTYTAAGTAGSGTVTSATVKSGPGTGIIYLQPAATAAGRVQIDGPNSLWVARVTASATQSIPNNTGTKITFNTASSTPNIDSYDPKGWFDDANDRIVVDQPGFYNITLTGGVAANTTGRRVLQILVNGSDRGSVNMTAPIASATLQCVSTNVYLAAGDYVEGLIFQTSGGALNTVYGAGVYPVLSVGRIGA